MRQAHSSPRKAERSLPRTPSCSKQRTRFAALAAVAEGLTAGVTRRVSDPTSAALLANVTVAIFRNAFDQWIDDLKRQRGRCPRDR
jgi:hypothetical protein